MHNKHLFIEITRKSNQIWSFGLVSSAIVRNFPEHVSDVKWCYHSGMACWWCYFMFVLCMYLERWLNRRSMLQQTIENVNVQSILLLFEHFRIPKLNKQWFHLSIHMNIFICVPYGNYGWIHTIVIRICTIYYSEFIDVIYAPEIWSSVYLSVSPNHTDGTSYYALACAEQSMPALYGLRQSCHLPLHSAHSPNPPLLTGMSFATSDEK